MLLVTQNKRTLSVLAAPRIHIPNRFEKPVAFEKGETIVLKIPFTGNPKPSLTWYKDGKPLKGSRYIQEVTERHAFLTIKDAEKNDGGTYRLDLENTLGNDSGNLTFSVNGERLIGSKFNAHIN